MSNFFTSVRMECEVSGVGAPTIARRLASFVTRYGLPPPERSEVGTIDDDHVVAWSDFTSEATRHTEVSSLFVKGPGYLCSSAKLVGVDAREVGISLYDEEQPDRLPEDGSRLIAELRAWFMDQVEVFGRVSLGTGPASVLPKLPIIGYTSIAVATTREQIAKHYEDVERFLTSGWATIEEHGEHLLCIRGLGARTGAELLEAVEAQHRALARIVKPGKADYRRAGPFPEERDVYYRDPPTLQTVAYDPDEKRLELSGVLEPGVHVRGWEIDHIAHLLFEKQTRSGEPLDAVSVVFPDRATADAEKRPLLDAGATVSYYGDDGELHDVEETAPAHSHGE